MEQTQLPLQGIKVVDFSQYAFGPVATKLLAELGADVIKIEPLEGDEGRPSGEPMVDCPTFILNNLSKRSIAVNLKDARGMRIVKKLCEGADVVVQNFRPGVMKRMGLDYETLSKVNPRLVYGSFYMFGETGPLAHRRGGDPMSQAFTGMVAVQGSPEGPPQILATHHNDYGGALGNAFGIMVALYHRDRTGIGQEVCNSLVNTGVHLQGPEISYYLMEGVLFKRADRGGARSGGASFPSGAYTAKDGFVVNFYGRDEEDWQKMCKILDIEYLLKDPRYDTAAKRNERKFELYKILDEAFSKRNREEWVDLFRQQRLRCDPCLDYAELVAHPQFAENKLAITVQDPREGEIRVVASPVRYSLLPYGGVTKHAPILGEHTREILRELGYTDGEIEVLHKEGVIGIPTPEWFAAKRTRGPKLRRPRGLPKGRHEEERRRLEQEQAQRYALESTDHRGEG